MHQHFDLTLCAPADTRTTLPLHARTHARTHMHTHTHRVVGKNRVRRRGCVWCI
jgi:hypothetical protein